MTTQTKHTPGPWELRHEVDSDGKHHDYVRGQYYIAEILPISKSQQCMVDANAHLIAAAPELLEALEHCLAYMEADADDDQEREDYATVRAAISKVRGE